MRHGLLQAASEQAWRERAIATADELYQEAVTTNGEPTAADQQWIADVFARTVGDGIAGRCGAQQRQID